MIDARPHPHLIVLQEGDVALLRIDREDKLGALSRSLVGALTAAFDRVSSDSGVGAVVLTGTGRGFIAGADIGEYADASQNEFDAYQRESRRLFDGVAALPQPVIAAVNGFALGGGFELALACDFIVASEDAVFALPEVRLGLLPGGGGTQRLARAAGVAFAKDLIMTGRRMRSDEAAARGIVIEVTPAIELLPRSLDRASHLAMQSRPAIARAKELIAGGVAGGLADGLDREQQVLSELFRSPDGREGVQAFIEKRSPVFADRTRDS